MSANSKFIYWSDNLRALATIAVIIAHVTMNQVAYDVNNPFWIVGNWFNGFSRFCVPVFAMITGAFLLSAEKDLEPKSFLKKRFSKVLIPFIFWNLLYSFYRLRLYYSVGQPVEVHSLFIQIKEYWFNGAAVHLWYIYVLLGLYLFIPIINKWIRGASDADLLYFIILWIISLFFWGDRSSLAAIFSSFSGFIGYLILGYFLFTKDLDNIKYIRVISLLCFIIGGLITVLGTNVLTQESGVFNHMFYDLLAPNVALISASIFVFLKCTRFFNQNFKILRLISQYSFGIYFIHIFSLWFLERFGISYKLINPYIGIPLTTVSCIAVSVFCLWLMNNVPFLRKFTGVG